MDARFLQEPAQATGAAKTGALLDGLRAVIQLQCARNRMAQTTHEKHSRMYKSESNEIAATGLRYTAKEGGSPFQGMGANGEFRSCLKCGEHKLRSKGAIHRFLSGQMFFCFDCKPRKLPQ